MVSWSTELVTVRLRESTIWFLPGRRSQRSYTYDVCRGAPPGGAPVRPTSNFPGFLSLKGGRKMAFFAPGGPPGFNQALLKGGTPPPAEPLASQVGKTDTSHKHDNIS